MGRVNDPNYCKYHRVVSHPVEKCFVLKELILKLAQERKIELDLEDVAQTNHAAVMIHPDILMFATGSLIQFGSLEPIIIYPALKATGEDRSSESELTEKEAQVENVDGGWTLVTCRKRHKQNFT